MDPLRTLNQLISPVSVKSRDVYNRLAQRRKLFTFSDNQQENVNIINRERPRYVVVANYLFVSFILFLTSYFILDSALMMQCQLARHQQ